MRRGDRDQLVTSVQLHAEIVGDGLLAAFARCDAWIGRGYPTGSYAEVSIASSGHGDPVGDNVAREQVDTFALELRTAEAQLVEVHQAMRSLVAFINRNTALAVQSIKGGSIKCVNCPHRMTGIGNDRPRVGRCTRCYTHWKRHDRDWPLKATG